MELAIGILYGILAFVGMQFLQFGIRHATASVTKKESRRDLEVEKIERTILEVRDLACQYSELPESDTKPVSLRDAIIGRITYVSMAIEELFRNDIEKFELVNEKYLKFFIASTGKFLFVKNELENIAPGLNIEVSAYVLIHYVSTQRIYLSRWKLWQRA